MERITSNPRMQVTNVDETSIRIIMSDTGLAMFTAHKYSFDPLGKLIASWKKVVAKTYGIDVCGTFIYRGDTILCDILMNTARCPKENSRTYKERFQGVSQLLTSGFIELVQAFLDSEEYQLYQAEVDAEVEPKAKIEACEIIFNDFLASIGLRKKT